MTLMTTPDHPTIQQAFVADHIADLAREGEAIRAERTRDHLLAHPDHLDHGVHPTDLPSRRIRLGQWLVAVGRAIAGEPHAVPVASAATMRVVAAPDPCDDEPARLPRAA